MHRAERGQGGRRQGAPAPGVSDVTSETSASVNAQSRATPSASSSVPSSVSPGSQILLAPVPAHWGAWQRSKNAVLYVLIRVGVAVITHVPYHLAYVGCLAIGFVAGLLPLADRQRAIRQLGEAMPELSRADCRRLARQMFMHFARSLAELSHAARFLRGARAVHLSSAQRELVQAAFAEGKGVVAVTAHIGNWELLAHVMAVEGFKVSSIAKPLYDPRLTRFVDRTRTAFGMRLIWRGDASSSKDMMTVFKERGMLALLIDQDTKVQGAFVPFFGRLAHTPTAPAAFAQRFGCPVIFAYGQRVDGRHELHFERVTPPLASGDEEADVLALTAMLSARIEAAIRKHPEQWVWLHRRWKQQPPAPAAARPT